MVRRRKSARRRSSRKMTIPLAPIAGFMAAPAINGAFQNVMVGHFTAIPDNLAHLIGIDPNTGSWNTDLAKRNWTPIIAGLLVHKLVGGKLGVNATLAAAKIPFVRL